MLIFLPGASECKYSFWDPMIRLNCYLCNSSIIYTLFSVWSPITIKEKLAHDFVQEIELALHSGWAAGHKPKWELFCTRSYQINSISEI